MKSFGRKVSTLATLGLLTVALSACGMFRDEDVAMAEPTQPTVASQPTTVQVQPVQPRTQEQDFQRSLQK